MSTVVTSKLSTSECLEKLGDLEAKKMKQQQYNLEAETRSSELQNQSELSKAYSLRTSPAKVVAFQIDGTTKQKYSKFNSFVHSEILLGCCR